jgi:hypothetical protein
MVIACGLYRHPEKGYLRMDTIYALFYLMGVIGALHPQYSTKAPI